MSANNSRHAAFAHAANDCFPPALQEPAQPQRKPSRCSERQQGPALQTLAFHAAKVSNPSVLLERSNAASAQV